MNTVTEHIIRISAIVGLVVFLSALPFLSGRHFDGVRSLALLAQIIGAASIVLVPGGIVRLVHRRVKHMPFSARPLYLIFVPGIALVVQLMLAPPFTERSRKIAIQNSAELIRDIEVYRAEHGHYPISLFAEWPDYPPGIIGMAQYHYEPNGESYNLTFEQPRFLLDAVGTREFVMYNPRDEHAMASHAAWRLSDPGELRGGYDVRDAGVRHWKCFLFD